MATLSVVISAYNEESKIGDCLKSVAWADEIIVIDNESTDKTAAIAKKYNAKVFKQPNRAMLNINKNTGFLKASSDWILNLDADERVTKELENEIKSILVKDVTESGYKIPRKNIIFHKWIQHGLWWPDYQVRLFKKHAGSFPCEHIHEYIHIKGTVGTLEHPMIHENYQSIQQFLYKMNTLYTESEMQNKIQSGYRFHWYDALRFPFEDFLNVYFARRGYKDGMHGLMLALLQACYAFIIAAKLWEHESFPEQHISQKELTGEIKRMKKQFRYWQHTQKIESTQSPIHTLLLKLKRKIFV